MRERNQYRMAIAVMWQGWMIQNQTESECDGMDDPGQWCHPTECKCKIEIQRYIEIAKGRRKTP